eukprot:Nitzschia sp. Nitz4//scaffold20_size174350//102778//104160//NITZ4_002110-RA/size174350-processed-gene-0.277-mRNA-1//1//CDS//3329541833//6876//frame0
MANWKRSFLVVAGIGLLTSCCQAFLIFPHLQYRSTGIKPLLTQLPTANDHSDNEDDEIPSFDWLTNNLTRSSINSQSVDSIKNDVQETEYIQEFERDTILGHDFTSSEEVFSVAETMVKESQTTYRTIMTPISKKMKEGVVVAQITTSSSDFDPQPFRYLVGLSNASDTSASPQPGIFDFALVDVPPFSEGLAEAMKSFMGKNGRLSCILITSREAVYYDDPDGDYSRPKSELHLWLKAFPSTSLVVSRLDARRDFRPFVTDLLDGDGPFAWDESQPKNATFVDHGIPRVVVNWDERDYGPHKILLNPSKEFLEQYEKEHPNDEKLDFGPEATRKREWGKRILAVNTPGRSSGSLSYIFPEVGLCASGYSIPLEDSGSGTEFSPKVDHLGYISTSKVGLAVQMRFTTQLVENYIDRFDVVLLSLGGAVALRGDTGERRQSLMSVVNKYAALGAQMAKKKR